MKQTTKKCLITIFSTALFVVGGIGVLANTNVQKAIANASTTPVEAEGNFEVQDGASIRVAQGEPSGIRWTVTVTKDFHDYVTSLGTTVNYYTLVNKSAIDEDDHNNTSVVKIPCTVTPDFNNEEEVWTFTAAIVYNQLKAELEEDGYDESQVNKYLQDAYEMELYARAYVEVVGSENTQYIYSECGDVVRSIKGVATHCLINNEEEVTEANKATFENLAGSALTIKATETQKAMKIESMYGEYTMTSEDEGATWSKTFVGEGSATTQNSIPAGTYTVYVGAKKVDTVTLNADGVATTDINGLGTSLFEVGKDYYANFVATNGDVYQTPFRYATAVIDEANDMRAFQMAGSVKETYTAIFPEMGGYYIMANSLEYDAGGTYRPFKSSDYMNTLYFQGGFTGTFEGNGYGIKNHTPHAYLAPILPLINGGTVRNLSADLVIAGGNYNLHSPLVFGLWGNSLMENIYLKVTTVSGQINYNPVGGALAYAVGKNAVVKNCVVVDTVTYDTQRYYGLFSGVSTGRVSNCVTDGELNGALDNASNVYYVSSSPIMKGDGYTIYAANETPSGSNYRQLESSVYRYEDNAAFAEATNTLSELPEGFNPELWTIDAINGLCWK